jgi:hypothetical protein
MLYNIKLHVILCIAIQDVNHYFRLMIIKAPLGMKRAPFSSV